MFGIISVLFTLISLIGAQDSESQLFKQLPARVITKDNFNAVINEPLHGTFILFQAPWCGRELYLVLKYLKFHQTTKKLFNIKIVNELFLYGVSWQPLTILNTSL